MPHSAWTKNHTFFLLWRCRCSNKINLFFGLRHKRFPGHPGTLAYFLVSLCECSDIHLLRGCALRASKKFIPRSQCVGKSLRAKNDVRRKKYSHSRKPSSTLSSRRKNGKKLHNRRRLSAATSPFSIHPHVDSQTSIFRLAFIPSPPPPFLGPLSRPHTYMHSRRPPGKLEERRNGLLSYSYTQILKGPAPNMGNWGLGGGGNPMYVVRTFKETYSFFVLPPTIWVQ